MLFKAARVGEPRWSVISVDDQNQIFPCLVETSSQHNFSFQLLPSRKRLPGLEMRYGPSRLQRLLRLNPPISQWCTISPLRIPAPQATYLEPSHSPKRWSSNGPNPADGSSVPATQPAEAKTAASPTLPSRKWSTPLAKTIAQAIEVGTPPMSDKCSATARMRC